MSGEASSLLTFPLTPMSWYFEFSRVRFCSFDPARDNYHCSNFLLMALSLTKCEVTHCWLHLGNKNSWDDKLYKIKFVFTLSLFVFFFLALFVLQFFIVSLVLFWYIVVGFVFIILYLVFSFNWSIIFHDALSYALLWSCFFGQLWKSLIFDHFRKYFSIR